MRFCFALTVVYLLAPEQSAKFMRDVLEGAEMPAAIASPSADQLVTFCKNNVEACRDLAMAGAALAPKSEKQPPKRVTPARD